MIETLSSLIIASGQSLPPVQKRGESISSAISGTGSYSMLTQGAETFTGRNVNPNTAMTSTAVWLSVKLISESVAQCPLITYRNVTLDGLSREPAITDYRYRMLREQPNEEMTSYQWRQFGMQSLLLWGNWYSYLDLDGRGRIKSIYPLRPDWVIVLRNVKTGKLEYRYTPMLPYTSPVPAGVYDPSQIMHVPGMGYDGVVGYSPIAMMRNAVALGQAQEEQQGRFVAGGGTQKVALTTPDKSVIKDPEKIKADWKRVNGGLHNTGEVAILSAGMDVKTFGIPPRDAQFLEGRSFQIAEIARIYNVPLGMLHDALSKPETFASAEQADQRFVKYSVLPWCVAIEQKVNTTILASNDAFTCRHDLTALVRGDLTSQATSYNTLVNGGLLTRNEARTRMDVQPHHNPMADELTVQMQVVPLGTTTPEPVQEPAEPVGDIQPQE